MVKSVYKALPSASAASGFVTSGAGIFYGLTVTTTATAGAAAYVAVFDASANSSGVYDYSAQSLSTAATRLLWVQQVNQAGSAAGTILAASNVSSPPVGIHFFKGLVVGQVTVGATAVAGSVTHNVTAVYRNGRPSNPINA